MSDRQYRLYYIASTVFFALWAVLFLGVLVTSLGKNAVDMWVRIGTDWRHTGNYMGLAAGFVAYALFAVMLRVFKMRHNLDWAMKFSHELTHTLVALLFGRKIYEFVVKGRDCYVRHHIGKHKIGYVPITLSPYCIPIYTFMLFPFRFAGDAHYMIVFDALIAFTYAFHINAFIKQTRPTQDDIEHCGIARSAAFISLTHLAVMSLILAIPKGGVLKAIGRVFWEYPLDIVLDPIGWAHEIIQYF